MVGRVSNFAAGSEPELRVRKVGLPIEAVFPKGLRSLSAMEKELEGFEELIGEALGN
jgi:hypothetical protein